MNTTPDIDAMWNTLRESGRDLAVLAPLADAYAELGETAMAECLKWCWEKGRRPRKATHYGYVPIYYWFGDVNFTKSWALRGGNNQNGPSNLPNRFSLIFSTGFDELLYAYQAVAAIWKNCKEDQLFLVHQWQPTLKARKVYG